MVTLNVTGPLNVLQAQDLLTSVDPVTGEVLKFEPVKESMEVGQRPTYKATTSKGRVYTATFDNNIHIATYLEEDAKEITEAPDTADLNPRAFKAGEEKADQPQKNLTQEEIDESTDRDNIDGGPVPPSEIAGRKAAQEEKKKEKAEQREKRKQTRQESKASEKQERQEAKETREEERKGPKRY